MNTIKRHWLIVWMLLLTSVLIALLVYCWRELLGQAAESGDSIHQLALILILGALGAQVQALISYADYTGNRLFDASWTIFYLKRPFVGATVALLTYATLRGGFVDISKQNPAQGSLWGLVAISLVAGLFSRQAMDKIGKVFDVVFSGSGVERRDGMKSPPQAAPVIHSTVPASLKRGKDTMVQLHGAGFSKETGVLAGNEALECSFVSPSEMAVKIPAALAGPETKEVRLTVKEPSQDASPSEPAILKVGD